MKKALLPMTLAAALMVASGAAVAADWGLGVEAGSAKISDGDFEPSASFVRIFGSLPLTNKVGLEIGFATTGKADEKYEDGKIEASYSGLDAAAVFRPISAAPGFFLRGGLTLYTLKIDSQYDDGFGTETSSSSESGIGYSAGLGYEHEVGPGALRVVFSVNPGIGGNSEVGSIVFGAGYSVKF
ncbi:hypothetical protein P3G55_24735 [Leptospira sp. 96542]|nr:hypothetical protein [Leptospira sp. 96542]